MLNVRLVLMERDTREGYVNNWNIYDIYQFEAYTESGNWRRQTIGFYNDALAWQADDINNRKIELQQVED